MSGKLIFGLIRLDKGDQRTLRNYCDTKACNKALGMVFNTLDLEGMALSLSLESLLGLSAVSIDPFLTVA